MHIYPRKPLNLYFALALLLPFSFLSVAYAQSSLPDPGQAIDGVVERSFPAFAEKKHLSFGLHLDREFAGVVNVSPEYPVAYTTNLLSLRSETEAIQAIDDETQQAFALRWDLHQLSQNGAIQFAFEYRTFQQGPYDSFEWQNVPAGHEADQYDEYFSELVFLKPQVKWIQFRITVFYAKDFSVPPIQFDYFKIPEGKPASEDENPFGPISPDQSIQSIRQANRTSSACPCPQPAYETRADWCTTGDCTAPGSLSPTTPTHLIIHHSATSLPPGSTASYRAAITGIFLYHTATLGWSDIGYNWLIDPSGGIYEGRGDLKQGAHMCGANGGTMGLCVLGDFTSSVPFPAATDALKNWLAWESCDKGISATGSAFHSSSGLTLNNISGHRDACATACPGNTFYPTFSALRTDVQSTIDACGASPGCPTPTGASASVVPGGVNLSWNDDPLYDNFVLQGRKVPGPFRVKSSTTNSKSFLLPAGNTYEWQVWANCSDGSISDPTALMSFTTLSPRLANGLRIYPNPASSFLQLHWENPEAQAYRIELLSLDGKLQWWVDDLKQNNHQVDVSGLENGLMIVRLISATETQQTSVIISNR